MPGITGYSFADVYNNIVPEDRYMQEVNISIQPTRGTTPSIDKTLHLVTGRTELQHEMFRLLKAWQALDHTHATHVEVDFHISSEPCSVWDTLVVAVNREAFTSLVDDIWPRWLATYQEVRDD